MRQYASSGSVVLGLLLAGACAPPPATLPPDPPQRVLPPPPLERPTLIPQPSDSFEVALSPVHQLDFSAFDMPIHVNDHVLAYIDVFTGRARPRFEQWLRLQGRYEALIREELEARGLPSELIYLALIESGYAPTAVSHANAVGLWQFIASTGRLEGLRIDDFIDERRDPVRATQAAAMHLQKLHHRFGSWYLAAAAYNAGSGRIDRALAAAGVAPGNDSTYWLIRDLLPLETRNYVPQLIAASIIGTHRHLFGFETVAPDAALVFDTVDVPDATEFAVLADAAGVDRTAIAELNTHFLKSMTPPGRAVQVRVPAGSGEAFRLAYAQIPADQRVRTRTHVVASGESLSRIAARYGTSVAAIQAHNRIERADRIAAGQRLVIPGGATPAAPNRPAATVAAAPTAAAGRVAPVAGPGTPPPTPESAAAADRASAAPAPAEAAAVRTEPAPARTEPATARTQATPAAEPAAGRAQSTEPMPTGYVVRAGDTLTGIAARHGMSLARLLELNGITARSVIRPGQRLDVGVKLYRVQTGDTLSSIARRHGVSTSELIEWNALPSDLIRPGDTLELRR